MPQRFPAVGAFLACLIASGAASAQAVASVEPTPEILVTTLLSGGETIIGQEIAYPDGAPVVTASLLAVPPGAETGWHIHEVPLFAYILEGTLTVDYGSEGVRHYGPGDSFLEAMNWPHNGSNRGEITVTLLAVYAGAEGLPNAEPADGPDGAASTALEYHVVAMDHFRSPREAQYRLDFLTVAATDPLGIGGIEGNQPAPDFTTVRTLDANGIPALEPALDRRHAGRQQALAGVERTPRPGVDDDGAVGFEMTRDPFLAGGRRGGLGEEPAATLAGTDGREGFQA